MIVDSLEKKLKHRFSLEYDNLLHYGCQPYGSNTTPWYLYQIFRERILIKDKKEHVERITWSLPFEEIDTW
jgi:hypothetical protein